MTQAEVDEHSVNATDFGGSKFMRINDLNSDWGLWFGNCKVLSSTHSGKENRTTACCVLCTHVSML